MWTIFRLLKALLTPQLFLVALVVCWKVWSLRNLEIHDSEHGFPLDVVQWASDYLDSYHSAQCPNRLNRLTLLAQNWVPPDPGFVKINVYVALPAGSSWWRDMNKVNVCGGLGRSCRSHHGRRSDCVASWSLRGCGSCLDQGDCRDSLFTNLSI